MADKKDTMKPGATFTKTITRGPNKGDKVQFKVAAGGKPFPIRVLNDKGGNSTLKNNPGVKFGKGKKKKHDGDPINQPTVTIQA